ncbi:hypothetical protein Hanom_Chr08g00715331 [Helianthus anomalus]
MIMKFPLLLKKKHMTICRTTGFLTVLYFGRLEIVKLKSLHSQGKIIGTLVTIGGAMIMTLIRGPAFQFPWTNQHNLHHQTSVNSVSTHDQIKGSLMITSGCFSWASFVIVQVSFTFEIQVKYKHLQSKYVIIYGIRQLK